ncbi:glycosyltransferase family 2 protein [Desulfurobacterium atlanticum]|uniref:Glycosyltransferase, GT2 family n=1 Tax=Desulfurobacterium atlanticum TaxID=240169 RepID=A0A238XPJ3_9BACT|nr:glycosyltransferase family 2 protein [Desulfurobacterium atlanticum]SNR60895.1 Glycosyltransferase, GT2 family [Desulfurobacterium atlanticum]
MIENNKETVCAVVVTYNRKDLLIECLEALRKQTRPLEGIYIIDNASTDGTPELLKEKSYIKELPPENLTEPWEKEFEVKNLVDDKPIKIHYVRMHENTGGAGGFYEGVKRAYKEGYDWLWLMDDDAEPKKDALEKLLKVRKHYCVSALASLKVNINGKVIHPHRGYFNFKNIFNGIVKPFDEATLGRRYLKIDHASFVGILVNREAIKKIGYPKKEFFIHYDDVEYCIRLRNVGEILLIPKSIIIHKEAAKKGIYKRFLWKKSLRVPYEKLWLSYYSVRNLTWLGKKYGTSKIHFYYGLVKNYLRKIIGIILFDDNKFKRIKFFTNAYLDGLKGHFDNEKPKKLLYKED